MFLLAGIHSKTRDLGTADFSRCPVCGEHGSLHVTNQYMTPHIFFIPTFRFRSRYLCTCGRCASLMELSPEVGRRYERSPETPLEPEGMQVLQNNRRPMCPQCGARAESGGSFCSACGARL